MTYANNLNPDEAPQNVGLHLRSKLFDIQIIYLKKEMGGNNDFFENFERNKYLKKVPSMQRVKKGDKRVHQWLNVSVYCMAHVLCVSYPSATEFSAI